MSSCSLSYLGGMFDRVAMISCGSDAVTDLVTGWIITPLPHDIGLDHHTLATWYRTTANTPLFELQSIYLSMLLLLFWYHPFLFKIVSTLGNAVYSWHLHAYCCVHWEWRAQILAVTLIALEVVECHLIFLGGRWPDELGSLVIRG